MPCRRLAPLLLLVALAVFAACSDNGEPATSRSTPTAPAETPAGGASPSACVPPSTNAPEVTAMTYPERPPVTIDQSKSYKAVVQTVRGDFTIQLRPDLAAETVNSFVFLAREGYFNGVTFHRVIPGFVAQGGDPTGSGSGGPGYNLPAEFSEAPYERGTVGMARAQSPDSGGSQFFIAYAPQPSLNGLYTVFGQVIEGMDVVDCLTPRDPAASPNAPPGDAIIAIEIVEE